MPAEIIDGNKIAEQIFLELKERIIKLKETVFSCRLVVILVGENPASLSYVKTKQKKAAEIGLKVEVLRYPKNISQEELEGIIKQFNLEQDVGGILVQLPLPEHLDRQSILDAVSPEIDIDCLTTENKQKLAAGEEVCFIPPAAAAVLKILDVYELDLENLSILIIGSGELVGKPLAALFLKRGINFKLANRLTENLPQLSRSADLIITGVGKPKLIAPDMVKQGAVVIDAGTAAAESGELVGDVDPAVASKASLLAPVPGGVGPITIAILLQNFVKAAIMRLS